MPLTFTVTPSCSSSPPQPARTAARINSVRMGAPLLSRGLGIASEDLDLVAGHAAVAIRQGELDRDGRADELVDVHGRQISELHEQVLAREAAGLARVLLEPQPVPG